MKSFARRIINRFGFDVVKLKTKEISNNPYNQFSKINKYIVDIENLGDMSLSIPGMITPESGKFLYTLCYMQELQGDVVEIGSWQGRSTTFLARAVKESRNGNLYAIDHFCGNVGKEEFYAVDGSVDNLKRSFEENISKFKLTDIVNLLDMPNVEASKKLKDKTIRFLFIDGDHTKAGVKKDIELFFPRLVKGSVVVFDDYFDGFSGLLEAVDEVLKHNEFSRVFYYRHTLGIKI